IENRSVHKYYQDQDQLEDQHQSFRNRTSLFKDQISRGNASLQLTEVKVQDEGRYKCFTNETQNNHKWTQNDVWILSNVQNKVVLSETVKDNLL
uniref:Immunoglobulin V-set domain-containing protein n=1 Tax=Acanthochromis polyacanthus TaxID=80966 RepID=A0A3Q1FNH9_9TELE